MDSIQSNKDKKVDMGYLVDFEKAIANHDAPTILRLWEEYTSSDEVDGEDFRAILEEVKKSELRDYIGRHIERSLPLWELVKDEELEAVGQPLDAKDADWMLIRYSGAKHSFTNPKADAYGMDPVGYDEAADKRSWQHMLTLFDEVFGADAG